MPARETVAGEAVERFSVSNSKITCDGMDIRSPLAKVSSLLSSIKEFIDSIHDVSTGASKRINLTSGFSSIRTAQPIARWSFDCLPAHTCLMILLRIPSFHSFVAKLNWPYNSPRLTAFGLIGYSYRSQWYPPTSPTVGRLSLTSTL